MLQVLLFTLLDVDTRMSEHFFTDLVCSVNAMQGLLIDGAREHGLPPDYIGYLQCLPRYHGMQDWGRPFGAYIFQYLWRPLLRRVVRLTEFNVDRAGNCPQWAADMIVLLYNLMWRYHDSMHRQIFGRGDGEKLRFEDFRPSLMKGDEAPRVSASKVWLIKSEANGLL